MSKDTSLTEFVGTAENEADDEQEADKSMEEERVEDDRAKAKDEAIGIDEDDVSEPDLDDVEPARATYDWTPDGIECDCCGSSVEKRWRSEDEMVCADCKEW